MLNGYIKILIQQVPLPDESDRNKVLEITNPISYSVDTSCDQLIQTAKVNFSRKIKKITQYNSLSGTGIFEDSWFSYDPKSGKKINFDTQVAGFAGSSKNKNPLIRYGDMIQIWSGYTYFDESGSPHNSMSESNYKVINNKEFYPFLQKAEYKQSSFYSNQNRSLLFTGYITSVSSQMDVKLECQDYMAFFAQQIVQDHNYLSGDDAPCKSSLLNVDSTNKSYKKGTLQGMLSEMYNELYGDINNLIKASNILKLKPIYGNTSLGLQIPFVFINNTSKNDRFGDIKMEHATIADFLKKVKDQGWAYVYFYQNSPILNLSMFRFNENPFDKDKNPFGYQQFTFEFQRNIIKSNLDFKRTDGQIVGAIVKNTLNISALQIDHNVKINGKPVKTGDTATMQVIVGQTGGKMFTFLYGRRDVFSNYKTLTQKDIDTIEKEMKEWGEKKLQTFYYEGYYGSFTTFGYPYVRHGDRVKIVDKILPDRDGIYIVNKVVYSGGASQGLRQEIFLGHKINTVDTEQK